MKVSSIAELRRMTYAQLLAYAEEAGDCEAAWEELADRDVERQFSEPDYE